ncbi:MAG: DUF465 domain-containing protein [Bacteroidetes bacterium]|nr:DUF465 domain-containing protein [Bacteroidota bacterium]
MDKHDLHHDFPELGEKIHELKISDAHFKKMFDEYHELTNTIHSIETGAEATSDEVLNEFRMKRVHLKDALYNILRK